MKTFIWLIGKPGSGKTTVGTFLAKKEGVIHFSAGDVLKQVQQNPSKEGYTMEDRVRANEYIVAASKDYDVVVVDSNPYSQIGFRILEQIRPHFDRLEVVQLCMTDAEALARLESRNREVLAHDGASEADRIQNFNTKLLPLIEEYKKSNPVFEVTVGAVTSEEAAEHIYKALIHRS